MSNTKRIAIGIAVVAAVVVGLGIWWFLRDDAPPEVSLEAAVATLDVEDQAEPNDASSTTADAVSDGVSGIWTVDTATGTFDYESASGSFAGFRIEEELAGLGSTTAVGRTGDIEGSITIEGTTVTAASFAIDTSTITTNDVRRDDNVWDALDVRDFPTANFVLVAPIDLGSAAASGEPVAVIASGELTIHGVTQPVEFELEAQVAGETIVVVGSTEIVFSDYDVAVPSSRIVLSVDNFGIVEFQLLLTR